MLSLPSEARDLLREAAKDANGTIFKIVRLGARLFRTNGVTFPSDSEPRLLAKFSSGFDSLLAGKLIADAGNKGQVFSLTSAGYEIADLLNKRGAD